jgi:folate-binding protein YgfZ
MSAASHDLRSQFAAFMTGAAFYKLPGRAKIALAGGDRVRWLNGMVTNNVRDLPAGHGVYSFLLNPQGHILGDLYAYRRDDSILVDTDHSQLEKLLATFDRYIIMDDVEVADQSSHFAAVGIAGPAAREVLRKIGLAADLSPLQFANTTWGQKSVTLVRRDTPKMESYEIWLPPEDADALFEELAAGATPVSLDALELLRIATGLPRYGQDIRERDLPQETGQDRALNFSKGCYVGQEIVERIRSRGAVHRRFTGFLVEGQLPEPGKFQKNGKDIGEVTSAAVLPLAGGDLSVALGYIRAEALAAGGDLQSGSSRLSASPVPFAAVFHD